MTKSPMFRMKVITDTDRGIKFESTIARPEILLTAVWLGTRKKNTATARMATAKVMTPNSLIHSFLLMF